MSWLGDHPFYLVIGMASGDQITIDLDEQGWLTTYSSYLRVPSTWFLVAKGSPMAALVMPVHEGEQPYYTAHTVGLAGSSGSNDIKTYGIGKKLLDGQVQRLWVLPGGAVCGGDDVDELGVQIVRQLGPRPYPGD